MDAGISGGAVAVGGASGGEVCVAKTHKMTQTTVAVILEPPDTNAPTPLDLAVLRSALRPQELRELIMFPFRKQKLF